VNTTTFFTFLSSLKCLVFLKLFVISWVFWKKNKETCIDSSSHTKYNLEIVHLSLHVIVSNPFVFCEYNHLFVNIPSSNHHNTIYKDDFFKFVYQALWHGVIVGHYDSKSSYKSLKFPSIGTFDSARGIWLFVCSGNDLRCNDMSKIS